MAIDAPDAPSIEMSVRSPAEAKTDITALGGTEITAEPGALDNVMASLQSGDTQTGIQQIADAPIGAVPFAPELIKQQDPAKLTDSEVIAQQNTDLDAQREGFANFADSTKAAEQALRNQAQSKLQGQMPAAGTTQPNREGDPSGIDATRDANGPRTEDDTRSAEAARLAGRVHDGGLKIEDVPTDYQPLVQEALTKLQAVDAQNADYADKIKKGEITLEGVPPLNRDGTQKALDKSTSSESQSPAAGAEQQPTASANETAEQKAARLKKEAEVSRKARIAELSAKDKLSPAEIQEMKDLHAKDPKKLEEDDKKEKEIREKLNATGVISPEDERFLADRYKDKEPTTAEQQLQQEIDTLGSELMDRLLNHEYIDPRDKKLNDLQDKMGEQMMRKLGVTPELGAETWMKFKDTAFGQETQGRVQKETQRILNEMAKIRAKILLAPEMLKKIKVKEKETLGQIKTADNKLDSSTLTDDERRVQQAQADNLRMTLAGIKDQKTNLSIDVDRVVLDMQNLSIQLDSKLHLIGPLKALSLYAANFVQNVALDIHRGIEDVTNLGDLRAWSQEAKIAHQAKAV